MTNANQIKKELKAAGIPTKNISVRCDSAIRVTISDLSIDNNAVEAVVNKHESYSRCEHSGEILSGGNTFVFVDYNYDALRVKWENAEFAETVMSDLKAYFGTGTLHMFHVKKHLGEWLKNHGGLAKGALESVVGSVLWGNREDLMAAGLELKH